MPSKFRVLIVEDDPDVAYVHRKIVSDLSQFTVVGVASSGDEALKMVGKRYPHLLLLDLGLAGMDGVTLLRKLRLSSNPVETIAVTAARDVSLVRSIVHLGVLDYLIKPFSPERFRQSLALFLHRMNAFEHADPDQTEIDAFCSSGRRPTRLLPKGLDLARLDEIRAALEQSLQATSAEQVAETVGMARVTARRYLEYLLATHQATVVLQGDGPGRPRKLYAVDREYSPRTVTPNLPSGQGTELGSGGWLEWSPSSRW